MALKKTRAKPKPQPSLSKSEEAALMRVYNAYWDNYIKGDAQAMAPLLDEAYTQVGSAESEVFVTKKDAVKFLHDTIDQVAGKVGVRNRAIRIEPHKEFTLITEVNDLYVLIGNTWAFHSKFRASSLMRKRKDGWKFYHQHSSFPDIRAQEGENMAIEKVALENLQLRDAVKRRTVELEQKTRDLEVEAALERVRARAMGMRNSSELAETSALLFHQIQELGINAIRTGVGIFDDPNDAMELWLTTVSESKEVVRILDYVNLHIHPVFENIIPARKANKPYALTVLKGNEVKQHYNTMSTYLSLPQPKTYNEQEFFYSFFFSDGAINVIAAQALTEEASSIMSRMASAFGVIYTRFLDLQKAEAQAREAQIELALERVRARTMAMQNSGELAELVSTLFHELTQLGFSLTSCNIWIHHPETTTNELWVASSGSKLARPLQITPFYKPFFHSIVQAWKANDPNWIYSLSGDEKRAFQEAFFNDIPGLPSEIKEAVEALDKLVFSASFNKLGAIEIVEKEELTEEKFDILHRFGKVFELGYTRFNDLKKAEAQAREAQIETALERIRSRSMAMHKSEELQEVIRVVYEQFVHLNILVEHTGFIIDYRERDDMHIWLADRYVSPFQITIPYFDSPHWNSFRKAKEKGDDFFANQLSYEEKNRFYEDLFKLIPALPEESRKSIFSKPGLAISTVLLEDVGLYIENFSGTPYTDEENATLMRFGKVFQQTYTRFLDLQKAEAQAREAQIQLSLERVRSRAMAMHQSDELTDMLSVLFEQFDILGVSPVYAYLNLFDLEKNTFTFRTTAKKGRRIMAEQTMALDTMDIWKDTLEKWKTDPSGSVNEEHYPKEILPKVFDLFQEIRDAIPEELRAFPEDFPDGLFATAGRHKFGDIGFGHSRKATAEEKDIVARFAIEFERLYQRFLDLQRAEAQAREAQIEAVLEKIRAASMAMHKSEELQGAINAIVSGLNELAFDVHTAQILIYRDNPKGIEYWTAASSKVNYQGAFWVPGTAIPYTKALHVARDNRQNLISLSYAGAEKDEVFVYLFTETDYRNIPEERKKFIMESPAAEIVVAIEADVGLQAIRYLPKPFSEEEISILQRLSKVFKQTYTRFLDLQKAEAQAREAQIEVSLERVRASAMAMHKSADVGLTMLLMFDQLNHLGVQAARSGIAIPKDDQTMEFWAATSNEAGESIRVIGKESLDLHPAFRLAYQAWLDQKEFQYYLFQNNDLVTYYRAVKSTMPLPQWQEKMHSAEGGQEHFTTFPFSDGWLYTFTQHGLTTEGIQILIRFSRVFGLTYRRYLDLQKAETQAHEARIETALERVRSRSLAMHKSEELKEVVFTLLGQLRELTITTDATIILTYHDDEAEMWIANEMNYTNRFKCPYSLDFFPGELASKKDRSGVFKRSFDFEKKNAAWKEAFEKSELGNIPESRKKQLFETDCFIDLVASNQNTGLMLCRYTNTPFNEAETTIVVRFANVLEQAYTRFLDLEKAEAQAREAQIEASLERVRGKAMAMHSSADLSTTIQTFYKELESLNLTPRRCGVGLLNRNNRLAELSTTSQGPDGTVVETIGTATMEGHPVLDEVYENWLRQTEYHPVLRGNEIKKYNQALRPQIPIPDLPADAAMYGYFFYFEEGGVYAYTEKELSEGELKVYRRFTAVLSLTYKRYKELKDAEERARIAVREASLDRVRAEIASMRHADDLQRITPLMWRELKTLGVPFFRCGVLIINEQAQKADYYLSTPEGQPLAALHLDFGTKIKVVQEALEHWRQQKVYIDQWNKEQFVSFARSMMELGQIKTMKSYQGGDQPPEAITLQFVPFTQGMLYVGSNEALSADQIELMQALADAFSTAYARYEDFTRLEAAKATVENTLSELRTTQTQLVQSEKMASLGELTAGIAHEIQNPLNFVNNFSEVSKELLDEMKAELASGNWQPAAEIAENVIQNLEKINFHGKRADGIVKSMLQHSRKSTGQKELTDINALCDEYLRLSYHGLRAKDKSFNAKFETSLDPTVGELNVLPQEIGRVILNLINNAFYAVSEKKKLNLDGYEPTVRVSTRKTGTHVEILVRDNGTGIPQKALDKIFNPFFTTKPTGQGTGLGLSLSYDIVTKGHGGELKVVTKEGEGSEFIVALPV